jgi:N-methylhydantoinase A
MQSNGGYISEEDVLERPVVTLDSGVAGGVMGGRLIGSLVDSPNFVTFDMGGTSTDVSLVEALTPTVTTENFLEWEGLVRVPAIDVESIGAGGGSIAWVDPAGALHVGPQSAGANPGPACYQRGGEAPTVTDANLYLGYLSELNYLGGALDVSRDAAAAALESLAGRCGLATDELALGIVRIVNSNMFNAIRRVSIERGHDPRDFDLMVFGGAGGLHAAALLEESGMRRAIVPVLPGNTSALGMLATRPQADVSQTVFSPLDELDSARIKSVYEELFGQAADSLARMGVPAEDIEYRAAVDMRYRGQVHDLTIDLPRELAAGAPIDRETLAERFHRAHEKRYSYANPLEGIHVVVCRASALGPERLPKLPVVAGRDGTALPAPVEREARFLGDGGIVTTDVQVRRWDDLLLGDVLRGPTIVESELSTILVSPGFVASVAVHGNVVIERERDR